MMIRIRKQRTKYHFYALEFPYNQGIVDFCRIIKDKYGWEDFSFENDIKKWVFSNLQIVEDFRDAYKVNVDVDVELDIAFSGTPPVDSVTMDKCRAEVKKLNLKGMKLRDYQIAALSHVLHSYKNNIPGNEIVVMPTGSGKSIISAGIAKLLEPPVLIIQPTKEILEQNLKKLKLYVDRDKIGVYSASMNEKTIRDYTFVTIQSVYTKPEIFKQFKYVIIDECDLVDVKNLSGMFMQFLREIDVKKVIGLTATPYRMGTFYTRDKKGELTAFSSIKMINRVRGKFWSRILYNVNISDLQENGYLSPLEYFDKSFVEHETLKLNKSQTDFDLQSYEKIAKNKLDLIINTVEKAKETSKSVLVFCSGINQARLLSDMIPDSRFVSGKTSKKDRTELIEQFKTGKTKVMFNVQVLTCGFDFPELDCIVLLRPTRSIRLYYQMLGRALRIAPGKKAAKIIDMTSTVKNIGRVETIRFIDDDGLWNIESERGKWHGKVLYGHSISESVL